MLIVRLKAAAPERYRENYRKEGLEEISALLARVLLEMHERDQATAKDVTPAANWMPLPPQPRANGQAHALPAPPSADEER